MSKAVVICHGGLHSSTLLAIALERSYEPFVLTFDWGNEFKKNATQRILDHFKIQNRKSIKLELQKDFIPLRNLIFLSYALSWAETLGVGNIFIDVNMFHFSHLGDQNPAFIHSFEEHARQVTQKAQSEGPFNMWAPLMKLPRSEIVSRGTRLGVPYEKTYSCHLAKSEKACGRCEGCQYRQAAFREAAIFDPTIYE